MGNMDTAMYSQNMNMNLPAMQQQMMNLPVMGQMNNMQGQMKR